MQNIYRYYYIFPSIFVITILILINNEYSKEKTLTVSWSDSFEAVFTLSNTNKNAFTTSYTIPRSGLSPQEAKIRIFSLILQAKKHPIPSTKDSLFLKKVLSLKTYTTTSKALSLQLSNKKDKLVDITIHSTKTENEEEYILSIKNNLDTALVLPYSLIRGSQSKASKNQLDVAFQSHNSFIHVSPSIEIKKHHFLLNMRNGIIKISNKKNHKQFRNIVIDPSTFKINELDLEPLIQSYLDKSYYAWLYSRYQRSTGTWRSPQSAHAFNENTLIASYSEAIQRNEISQLNLMFERIASIHKSKLSWKSQPILGTNNVNMKNSISVPPIFNNSLFQNMDLFESFLLDPTFFQQAFIFYPKDIQNLIVQLLQSFAFINSSPELAASLLYQSISSPWKEINTIIKNNAETLEIILLNNFVSLQVTSNNISIHTEDIISFNRNDVLFFLSTSNNILDSKPTLLAAKYFINQSKKNLISFGKRIIYNLLLQSDQDGFFPRWYTASSNSVESFGYIAPESIHAFLTKNHYYPTIYFEDGLYILSVSPITFRYENKELGLKIPTISPEITTYVYIWNNTPPSHISAFDILWKGNYNLDGLLRGVQYKNSTQTTMIKIKSKKKSEQIRIRFK